MTKWIPIFILLVGCQTAARETVPVKKVIAKQVEAFPPLPAYPDFSDPVDIGCNQFPKLAMLSCLYPEQAVPFPYCELKDSYAIQGIIPFAFCTNDVDILYSHIGYARSKYRPSTIGLMERAMRKMQKDQTKRVSRPLVYTRGLIGREAWDLMQSIHIEYQISGKMNDAMKQIIFEQSRREPSCAFYQFLSDTVEGKFEASRRLALDPKSGCSYHRFFDADGIKIERYYVQSLIRKATP